MATQGTFGVKVKIDVSSTMTAIVQILEAAFPKQLKELAEMTAHPTSGSTGWKEYVDTGVRELGEFPVTMAWDDSLTTHQTVLAAFNSTSPVAMSVEDPAGNERIQFSAFIKEIARLSPSPDGYKAQVVIRPTGAPTIA